MLTASRRKRTRYELLADLLESSRGGARKTTLMFRANLSFQLLGKYLTFLVGNGFLESHDGVYFPSRRGLAYLRRFGRFKRAKSEMAKSEGLILSMLSVAEPVRSR